jgi:hypothetical protein
MHNLFETRSITLFLCAFCAFSWLKNPFNLRNPRLINNLRLFKVLYNCKETFTDVMKTLQIKLFLQNEPKFRKVKFSVNKVLRRVYDQLDTWSIRKTKPIQSQSKPIQSQLKPIKANKMPKQTQFKPKTNPTCRGVASGEDGNKPNFQELKMLLRLTINTRRKSLGHYADWRLFAGEIPNRRQEFLAANYEVRLDFYLKYV